MTHNTSVFWGTRVGVVNKMMERWVLRSLWCCCLGWESRWDRERSLVVFEVGKLPLLWKQTDLKETSSQG